MLVFKSQWHSTQQWLGLNSGMSYDTNKISISKGDIRQDKTFSRLNKHVKASFNIKDAIYLTSNISTFLCFSMKKVIEAGDYGEYKGQSMLLLYIVYKSIQRYHVIYLQSYL